MAPEGLRKQKRISEMLLQKGVMVPRGIRNRKMKENFRYAAPGRTDGPTWAQLQKKKINSIRGTWNSEVLGSPSSPGAWALLFSPPAQHLEHSEVPVLPPYLAQLCNNSPVGTGSSSIMGRRQKEFYTTEVKKTEEKKRFCAREENAAPGWRGKTKTRH